VGRADGGGALRRLAHRLVFGFHGGRAGPAPPLGGVGRPLEPLAVLAAAGLVAAVRAVAPARIQAALAGLAMLAHPGAAGVAVLELLVEHRRAARADARRLRREVDDARHFLERRAALHDLLEPVLADRAHPGFDRRGADGGVGRAGDDELADVVIDLEHLVDAGAAVVAGVVAVRAAAAAPQRDGALLAAGGAEPVEVRRGRLVGLLA